MTFELGTINLVHGEVLPLSVSPGRATRTLTRKLILLYWLIDIPHSVTGSLLLEAKDLPTKSTCSYDAEFKDHQDDL